MTITRFILCKIHTHIDENVILSRCLSYLKRSVEKKTKTCFCFASKQSKVSCLSKVLNNNAKTAATVTLSFCKISV